MTLDLVPMTPAHLPLLAGWLEQPHVAQWWRDPEPAAELYAPCLDGTDPTELWLITEDGTSVGFLQTCLFADEPEWSRVLSVATEVTRAGTLDYLIGDVSRTGRGLGTSVVDLASARMLARPDVDRMVVSVTVDNRPSWRALERAGYRIVWTGLLDTDDPSDRGEQHVLLREP